MTMTEQQQGGTGRIQTLVNRTYDRVMAWQERRPKAPEQHTYNDACAQVREGEVWTHVYRSRRHGDDYTVWTAGQARRVPDDWFVAWYRGLLMIAESSIEADVVPWRGEGRALAPGDVAPDWGVDCPQLDAPPAVAFAQVKRGQVIEAYWVDPDYPRCRFVVTGTFHGVRGKRFRRGWPGVGGGEVGGWFIPAEATVTGCRVLP